MAADRVGQLTEEEASALLVDLINSPVAAFATESLLDAALRLAMLFRHPVYDCVYLALAVQHGTHVVTADRRFAALAERAEVAGRIRLLGA